MKHTNFKMKTIAAVIGLTTLAGTASAEVGLEVITVSANKRIQSLGDVPVSIQVVSGDALEDQNILDFKGVVERLPNVYLSTAPGPSSISIRGIGTGSTNAAAEQSVGIYVDGIYVSRGHQFNAPFTDIQRVEILKGPQGVLQGKNSIAGAVVITSRRPTEDFEASVKTAYELENSSYNVETMLSGGLTDNLFGRIVAQKKFTGGWLDTNTRLATNGTTVLNGEKDQNDDEFSVLRASLVWEASDSVSVFVKAEVGERDTSGVHFGPSAIQPGATTPDGVSIMDTFLTRDPDFDFIGNGIISNGFINELNPDLATFNPLTGLTSEGGYEAGNRDQGLTVENSAYSAQVDWDLAGGTLTSISGYSEFEHEEIYANSMSPTDWISFIREQGNGGETFDQFTQEIRFVSLGGETIDYIVGGFYMDRNIKMSNDRGIINLSNSGLWLGPTFALPPFLASAIDSQNTKFFDENTTSLSAFAQVTWNISDDFRINVGARYTNETKKVNASNASSYVTIFPDINNVLAGIFGAEDYITADLEVSKIEENGVDPSVSVQWDVNNDVMLYASATQATKAGGFNSSSNSPTNFHFDTETATGYEAGLKGVFFDNNLFFNFALYQSNFDDLQVSALDATTNSFFFKNAAEATTQGFEADFRYAVTSDFEIGGAVAYTDATYDNFPGASCSTGTSREADCDAVTSTRNAKGNKLTFAPEWSGSIYASYHLYFDNDMSLDLRSELMFSDEYYFDGQNDPYLQQDSYAKLDVSINLNGTSDNWKLSILGKNLTDETTVSFGGATPFYDGAYWSNVEAPRQVFLTAEYKWF